MKKQMKDFMAAMTENAVAIIPAGHEQYRSYDTEFKFHQDPDFQYLTDFPEPDAIAVLETSGKRNKYTLFVRPRNEEMEIWYGRRTGVEGAVKKYGADKAYSVEKLETELPKLLHGKDALYYRFGVDAKLDAFILRYFSAQRFRRLKTPYPPHTIIDPTVILFEMRLHKSPQEIEWMQTSATIAAEAHMLAMKNVKPGMFEYQVEALMENHIKQRGSEETAYNAIVGGGENACILHYVENNCALKDGEMLLIDFGANYKGYASDITRTFPINGRFSPAQREVYEIVLDTQKQCVAATKTGMTIRKRQDLSVELLTEGMKKLGLLKGKTKDLIKKKAYMKYYMHGIGHYLGLDVHDTGRFSSEQTLRDKRPFAPGMVLTVEPGLYIPPDDKNAPARFRGLGIRIEDDVLVTEDGNLNLTATAPREIEEIEQLMNPRKKK